GGCGLCETCAAKEKKPCRHPDKAFSSLEAYCMNVSLLAEKCSMEYINMIDGSYDTVTYFGIILY
ncbi:MAG TPA: DUF2284 domain-containing protein, partial [Bacillota bacterium]|nr:DUF2284 domain-containing protein [Bacillota bacterium]